MIEASEENCTCSNFEKFFNKECKEKLLHILLLKSEKVIGKLEDKIEVKIQEDRQSNIENTTLKELEQKHSKFKGNKKWN